MTAKLANDKVPLTTLFDLIAGEKEIVYVANHGNLGDALIAHATFEFFKEHKINVTVIRATENVEKKCVIISGGGNLVEGKYQDIADFLARCGARNRIILLPHTIVGYIDLLRSISGSLYVFARERKSAGLLTAFGYPQDRLFIAEDMAFSLRATLPPAPPPRSGSVLVCLREDVESAWPFALPQQNFDISKLIIDHWDNPSAAHRATELLFAHVTNFERVVTDRLHVAIAAFLLGRTVTLLSNDYFKNEAVYDFSMKDAPNVSFLKLDTTDLNVNRLRTRNATGVEADVVPCDIYDRLPFLYIRGADINIVERIASNLATYPGVERWHPRTDHKKTAELYIATTEEALTSPAAYRGGRPCPIVDVESLNAGLASLAAKICRRQRMRVLVLEDDLPSDDLFLSLGGTHLPKWQYLVVPTNIEAEYPFEFYDGLRTFTWLKPNPAWIANIVAKTQAEIIRPSSA